MKPPRWKMWQGVYKGSGVPVFKIPLSGGLLHMSQFVSRKTKCYLNLQKVWKNYINLEYLPL